MAGIPLVINGKSHTLDLNPDIPLLWVLRDHLGLTGTKYGCGRSLCGACTVHVDGEPVRSCVTTIGDVTGKRVTTIEGLANGGPNAIQEAWIAEQVPQCGYCQSGQIMAVAALLAHKPNPTDAEIDEALDGILCRCGTYPRARRAIHRAASGGGR